MTTTEVAIPIAEDGWFVHSDHVPAGSLALGDVVLLRWPEEACRRAELVRLGMPRLLLIDDDRYPPATVDCLEDWIRCPAAGIEVALRCSAISARAVSHAPSPILDDDDVLHYAEHWVALTPLEGRLVAALLERPGRVSYRDRLYDAAWPGTVPAGGLDVHIMRLRRRIAPLGLAIHTVRRRGYVLEVEGRQIAEQDADEVARVEEAPSLWARSVGRRGVTRRKRKT